MLNAPIGVIEILRIDALELLIPDLPTFITIARVDRRQLLFRNEPSHDLHNSEPFPLAIGSKLLKAFPAQSIRKAGPPSIAKPEERRAIRMFEVAPVHAHSKVPTPQKLIGSGVGLDRDAPWPSIEIRVCRIGALQPVGVLARDTRCEAHGPAASS